MTTQEPTIGQLVAGVTSDLSTLVRDEIELAKTELRDDAKSAGKGAGMLGTAAFLGVLFVIFASFAAAYGLMELGLHPAWAFLIVGGVYLLVAIILALIGKSSLESIKPPERALASAQDTKLLLKADGRESLRSRVPGSEAVRR